MPVVINEFEVVADATPARRRGDADSVSDEKPHEAPEPGAIAPALRSIEARALRSWAH